MQSNKQRDIDAYNAGRLMFFISKVDGEQEEISMSRISNLRTWCRQVNIPDFTREVMQAISYKIAHPTSSFILMFVRHNGSGITFHDY